MQSPAFLVIQILVPALGAVAGGGLLLLRARGRGSVSGLDVLRSGLWVAGAAGLATLAGALAGVIHGFGVIRMAFLAGVVSVPVVASGLLVAALARRVEVSPAALALAVLGLCGAPLGGWMAFVEPYDLRLETAEVALAAARAGVQPVRVGVLADLQCDAVGSHERRAIETLMAQQPDLVLVPGDLFQGGDREWRRWRAPLMELLATVRAPHGVFFVPGDTDHPDTLAALREHTDWRILLNEIAEVPVRDRTVRIAGVATRGSFALARELEALRGDDDVRLVVSHARDVVLRLDGPPRADLIVAGHTHGGQVVVPLLGPPMTLSHVPRSVAAGGLHVVGERAVYVSRGVGLERRQAPRVRLLCPPEVTVLTLR